MVFSTSYIHSLVFLDCFTWSSPPPMITNWFCWIVLPGHLYFLCSQLGVVGLFYVLISTSFIHKMVFLDCFMWSSPPPKFTTWCCWIVLRGHLHLLCSQLGVVGLFNVVFSNSYIHSFVLWDCFTWSSPPPMFTTWSFGIVFTWSAPPPKFKTWYYRIVLPGHLHLVCFTTWYCWIV